MGTSPRWSRAGLAAASVVCASAITTSVLGGESTSGFPKRIAKEPAYGAAVQYFALFVLGPDEDLRVWMVADGDRLYVDSNGNGDLTERGERFDAFRGSQDDFVPLWRKWKVGKLAATDRYVGVEVNLNFANPRWRPAATASNAAEMTKFMDAYSRLPYANFANVHVVAGGRTWLCTAAWATTKAAAPVFRMDSKSFELGVIETLVPHVLSRRPELETLSVGVGACGWGGEQPGCFSWVDCRVFGKFARVDVEIEFPADDGTYLPVRRYPLYGSC